MSKFAIAALLALCAAAAFAAPDANTASRAELEAIRGVGPDLASKILDARHHGEFKDWADFVARVAGVGGASAARLSAAGLTVRGATYQAAAASAARP